MKSLIKRGSTLLLALVLVLTLVLAVNIQVQSAYADDLNWGAFQVDISTADTVKPGSHVTFDVKITNTIKETVKVSLRNFYYREFDNSETYPGETFGDFSGSGLQVSDEEYDVSITIGEGQTVPLTLSGTIPTTWNDKSEICIVVDAYDKGYMGQGDFPDHSGEYDKAENTLWVKGKTAAVSYSKVKKAAQALAITKVIRFTDKGQGTKTYTKVSGNSKITINKSTGKVTVKKGLKKGTYAVKIKVKAAGDEDYGAAIMTVTFKIKVK